MNNEELILQRLERLEEQMAPVAAMARSAGELREEMTPRVNEAVQALITELADVEADFQVEDLIYLVKKMMRNIRNLNFALDQMKNLIDFALTAEPLLKATVPQAILEIDKLEQSGVFRLMNTGVQVLKGIGSSFTAAELEQVGGGLVRLGAILKKLTAPAALDLLERAADLPARVDLAGARPVGLFGMLGAMGDQDIQRGLGVLLELTKGLALLRAAS